MTDLFSKFDALIAEKAALIATGVRDPIGIVPLYWGVDRDGGFRFFALGFVAVSV